MLDSEIGHDRHAEFSQSRVVNCLIPVLRFREGSHQEVWPPSHGGGDLRAPRVHHEASVRIKDRTRGDLDPVVGVPGVTSPKQLALREASSGRGRVVKASPYYWSVAIDNVAVTAELPKSFFKAEIISTQA